MQPLVDTPRSTLTDTQVVTLIQNTPALVVTAGLEIIDRSLSLVEDVTDDLLGGTVSRSSYANLHGTAQLSVSRELDWGQALVRPYVTLTGTMTGALATTMSESLYSDTYADAYGTSSTATVGTQLTARFNLGAYFPSTPVHEADTMPMVNAVQGYDILLALTSPVGEAYAVDQGAAYLATVETILLAQGFAAGTYLIDQTRSDAVLPTARVWPIDERNTWLIVVNDLLGSIGYAGIWSDWDGRLRCAPYQNPRDRAPEWLYDLNPNTGTVTLKRTIERDWFFAPNRWVGIRNNDVDAAAPVEGNGIYTYTNQHDGPTSVEDRGGRVITRILPLDAADQASLVAQVERTIDADLRLKSTVATGTGCNPLHWHFDLVTVNDPCIGSPFTDALVTEWTLPLNGDDMSQSWTLL